MAEFERDSQYPPDGPDDNRWRDRRPDGDYRRDYDRHQRRRRSRSRDRQSSDRRYDRDRRRSRSRSMERSRRQDRDYRDSSPPRRRSSEYNHNDDYGRGDAPRPRRSFDHDGDDYNSINDSQGSARGSDRGARHQEKDWRMRLTSIRDAHFNRSKQPPLLVQNQFQNDGSFMDMFKKKMAADSPTESSLTPNSLVLASSSIQYSDISLPPLTAPPDSSKSQPSTSTSSSADQDLDGVPIKRTTLPVPVSVGRRRCAKPLKTGVVFKKKQKSDEDEGSQEKLDAWARYLQEVQKYKNDNLVEDDGCRPLVK